MNSKKRFFLIFAPLPLLYVIGFFTVTPIMLSSDTLKAPVQSFYKKLYQDPVMALAPDNTIRVLWTDVNLYWCERDNKCGVSDL